MGYNEICDMLKKEQGKWIIYDDDEIPYTVKDNKWISFDDAK